MELRRLPEPDAAAFMDRGIVFPDLLRFCKGAPYGCSYRCNANKPPPVRAGTLRRSSFGNRTADARLPRRSRRILWQVFWMVRMGAAACACFGHTDSCAGICFVKRLAAGKNQTMADICLDGCPVCVYGASSAGDSGTVERQFFRQLSSDTGNIGSCFLFACISCFGAMYFTDVRHFIVRLSQRTKSRKIKWI